MDDLIQSGLAKSKIYQSLKTKCEALNDDVTSSAVIGIVTTIVIDACEKSKTIIKYMPEYTLHDETHLFRVYALMERLIPESTLQALSIPELMLLTLSAFLHDIGMAPQEEDIRAWKQIWNDENNPTEIELSKYETYSRFRNNFPQKITEIDKLRENENFSKANLIEDFLISEYIRYTHPQRAIDTISNSVWLDRIRYKYASLKNELAQLCYSHGKDALHLLEMEMNTLCDEDTFVCMPFLGVILRLSDILDFDAKRTPSVLFSHLSVRNPVSLKEWQKHRSVQAWIVNSDFISFKAICDHPAIEKSIKDFCDLIDIELANCNNVLSRIFDDQRGVQMNIYRIKLPARVDRARIQASKDIKTNEPIYIYKDTAFSLSKNQVIDLLMGTKLYDDTKSALRELVQNSIDACLVAKAIQDKLGYHYTPQITIRYYNQNGENILEVEDNGVGMNQHVIDKYYSKVGSSYYKSKDFEELKAQTGLKFKPISRFGIGILSCFMVADTIEVETRKLLDDGEKDIPYYLSIEGYDSLFTTKKGIRKDQGTKTKIYLRPKENPWDEMSNQQFISYVKQSIPNPPVKIIIDTDKENCEFEKISIDETTFSETSAEQLEYYYWKKSEYIKEIKVPLTDETLGFRGEAIVAILEKNDTPVNIIEGLFRKVKIEDEEFELENKVKLTKNDISQTATVIEVGIESEIKKKITSEIIVRSKSKFSIHGIDFPDGIFPDFLEKHKLAKLRWFLPMLLVLDITGANDVDLNSARTEIVFNENWNRFEENLAFLICRNLRKEVGDSYWKKIFDLLIELDNGNNFKYGLEKANNSLAS